MKLQFTIKQIAITLILGAILAFILISRGKYKREADRLNLALFSTQQTVRQKDIIIQGLNQKVFTQEAQVVSSTKALKQSEEEKEYLKKLHIKDVKTISNLGLEVEVLKKQGTYKDTVIVRDTITNVVDTVKMASYKDQWVYATVVLYPDNPVFNFGVTNLPLKIILGYQREGLFKKQTLNSVITTECPYVQINKINTIVVQPTKPLWYRIAFPVGVGIGYLLGSCK